MAETIRPSSELVLKLDSVDFLPRPLQVEISVEKPEGDMYLGFDEHKLPDFLQKIFVIYDPITGLKNDNFFAKQDRSKDTNEEKIIQILDGLPGQWTNGDKPHPTHNKKNVEIISDYVSKNEPIPFLSVIGTMLHPAADAVEKEESGLTGSLMVNRLYQLDTLVRAYHEPGIELTLLADDWVSHYFFDPTADANAVEASQVAYMQSLQTVVSVYEKLYGKRIINFVTESELYSSRGISYETYKQQADKFQPVFTTYLNETDLLVENYSPEDADHYINVSQLDEDLADIGWKGSIPKSMRDFYKQRMKLSGQYQTEVSDQEMNEALGRWFASTLTKRVLGGIKLAMNDKPFLRVSFVQQPPGAAPEFSYGWGISAHPRSSNFSTTQTTPPWRGVGIILEERNKLKLQILPTTIDLATVLDPETGRLRHKGVYQARLKVNGIDLVTIPICVKN